MNRSRWLSCLVLLIAFLTANAQPPALPTTAAPTFVALSGFDPVRGVVQFLHQELIPVSEKKKIEVTIGEQKQIQEVDVTTYKTVMRESKHDLATLVIQNRAGEVIPPEKVVEIMKTRPLVILAGDQNPVDAAFLRLLDKDTLIFSWKQKPATK